MLYDLTNAHCCGLVDGALRRRGCSRNGGMTARWSPRRLCWTVPAFRALARSFRGTSANAGRWRTPSRGCARSAVRTSPQTHRGDGWMRASPRKRISRGCGSRAMTGSASTAASVRHRRRGRRPRLYHRLPDRVAGLESRCRGRRTPALCAQRSEDAEGGCDPVGEAEALQSGTVQPARRPHRGGPHKEPRPGRDFAG